MSFINRTLAPSGEPLTQVYSATDCVFNDVRTATVYRRHPLPEMAEGDVWAAQWRVVTSYDNDPRIVSNKCFLYYDDAEAAADTWVYHGEVSA